MSESSKTSMRVALLVASAEELDELREAVREAGAKVVYEGDTAGATAGAIRAAAPDVVLVNLPASMEEHSPMLDELAAAPELRVVFNDASITSALSGWDRARWRRHLAAKMCGSSDDLPPRPDDALALRLPGLPQAPLSAPIGQTQSESERVVVEEIESNLAQIADTRNAGPPPRHDWSSDLHAEGLPDTPLDSFEIDGVAQGAMAGQDRPDPVFLDAAETHDDPMALSDDERHLLGNLESLDNVDETRVSPPLPGEQDALRGDPAFDESLVPGTQVQDFPPNDLGAPLGAADMDLRNFDEITSDEAASVPLDPPQGFSDLTLAEDDAGAARTLHVERTAAAPPISSGFGGLELEALDADGRPLVGRASFEIDTSDRFVANLGAVTQEPSRPVVVPRRGGDGSRVDTWLLLGGSGSGIDMLEFLGELPTSMPVSIVVARADIPSEREANIPLDAWPPGTALPAGVAATLDLSRTWTLDAFGQLTEEASGLIEYPVDTALGSLSRRYGERMGVMLFDGQRADGCAGISEVVANGGTVWCAASNVDTGAWNDRARALNALSVSGSGIDLARRLATQHAPEPDS